MKIANNGRKRQKTTISSTHDGKMVTTMDETDHQLIALLRQNARMSIATLATKLKVSRGTVTNRLNKLEDEGIIAGYTIKLRPDIKPQHIRAWMSIAVEGNQTRAVVANLIMGEPGVATLCDTNGRWDLLAELRAENLQDLAKVLERIRLLKGISNTETSIHLETFRLA
jgi:DNA-binding Lrp family transcriptional regulator